MHPLTSGEKKMAAAWELALVPVLSRGAPVPAPTVVTTVPTSQPTVIVPVPTTSPTVFLTAVPTTATPKVVSRFGARVYRIGSGNTTARSGISGSTLTGSARARTTVSSVATALTPPATSFTRWYPAARWSAGLR